VCNFELRRARGKRSNPHKLFSQVSDGLSTAEVRTEQRNQPGVISLPTGKCGACAWLVRALEEIVLPEGWYFPPFLKKTNKKTPQNLNQNQKSHSHFLATCIKWSCKKC